MGCLPLGAMQIVDLGEIVAEAQDVMVKSVFNRKGKVQFPTDLKEMIEHIEEKSF